MFRAERPQSWQPRLMTRDELLARLALATAALVDPKFPHNGVIVRPPS